MLLIAKTFLKILKDYYLLAIIKKLRLSLRNINQKFRRYKMMMNKKEQRSKIHSKIFNKDQINYLEHGTIERSTGWSDDTINKALKLYMACGTKGYEELRRQNLPFSNILTLQHRIRLLKFNPGIIEDVFNLLKLKVSVLPFSSYLF